MTSTPQEHMKWTAAGSNTAAQNTYASIRQALKELASRRSLDIFLQGSYANATNIRADSDVDTQFGEPGARRCGYGRPRWGSRVAHLS
jgi:hypothetical protein